METLRERLEWATERAGCSKADIARACDTSPTAVGYWFDGSTADIKLKTFYVLADFLRVEARWLATGEGPRVASEVTDGDEPEATDSDELNDDAVRVARIYDSLPDSEKKKIMAACDAAWKAHVARIDA